MIDNMITCYVYNTVYNIIKTHEGIGMQWDVVDFF